MVTLNTTPSYSTRVPTRLSQPTAAVSSSWALQISILHAGSRPTRIACDADLQRRHHGGAVSNRACPKLAAAQSAEARGCAARPGVQYGGFVHNEYELAGVCAGNHHVVPDANGRPRVSQLYFRGGGSCSGHRRDPRDRAAREKHHRKLLGGYDARDAVGAAAGVHRGRILPPFARRGAGAEAVHNRATRGSADGADHWQ